MNPQLQFIEHKDGDAIVSCPFCHCVAPLMSDFSLLKAGSIRAMLSNL